MTIMLARSQEPQEEELTQKDDSDKDGTHDV